MRSTRIYTTQALHGNTVIELEPEPSRHVARALRMQVGDQLTLFNGHGGEYPAVLVALGKKNVQVQTNAHQGRECESGLDIHLGIGISRGERMDWVVQKSTELGVRTLTPLFTECSGVKLAGERTEKKMRHWRQIAISACEQCGRNQLPVISPLQNFDSWLESVEAERKLLLHHRADTVLTATAAPASVALLVGPEGGLSRSEIEAAEQAGFSSLALGPRVLRTETAPLAALTILQSIWGDMQPG